MFVCNFRLTNGNCTLNPYFAVAISSWIPVNLSCSLPLSSSPNLDYADYVYAKVLRIRYLLLRVELPYGPVCPSVG